MIVSIWNTRDVDDQKEREFLWSDRVGTSDANHIETYVNYHTENEVLVLTEGANTVHHNLH